MISILIPIGLWVGYSLLKNSKAVAAIAPSIEVPGVFPWGTTLPYSIRDAPSPDLPSRDYYPPATPPETIRSAALSTLVGDLVSPVSGVLGPLLGQASLTLVENLMIPVKRGVLGTKNNPIPMNKWDGGRGLRYYASTATGSPFAASTPLVANVKTWFVVDTTVTGVAIRNFLFAVQGFNNVDLFYTKVVQDRAGNDLSAEVGLQNNTGDTTDTVYNYTYNFGATKFLYSIESRGKNYTPTINVQFMQ